MPDTIAYVLDAVLHKHIVGFRDLPSQFSVKACGDIRDPRFLIKCDLFDLVILGQNITVNRVEVSLSKLLFGHSGRLISSQEKLDLALKWLEWILKQLMRPRMKFDGLIPGFPTISVSVYFTRLDIPWHFSAELSVPSALHRGHHRLIRSDPSIIRGETITFNGSLLKFRCYRKTKQLKLPRGLHPSVDRLECSFSKKALEKHFRQGSCGPHAISFEYCKDIYRAAVEGFDATCIDTSRLGNGVADFVAELAERVPEIPVVKIYESRRGFKPDTARKFEKEIRDLRKLCGTQRLTTLLPENGPWKAEEIVLPDQEEFHRIRMDRMVEEFHEIESRVNG